MLADFRAHRRGDYGRTARRHEFNLAHGRIHQAHSPHRSASADARKPGFVISNSIYRRLIVDESILRKYLNFGRHDGL
jgi:hypothetical protein